jgi:hypothetical protein
MSKLEAMMKAQTVRTASKQGTVLLVGETQQAGRAKSMLAQQPPPVPKQAQQPPDWDSKLLQQPRCIATIEVLQCTPMLLSVSTC